MRYESAFNESPKWITSDTHWHHSNILKFSWATRKQFVSSAYADDAINAVHDMNARQRKEWLWKACELMDKTMTEQWNDTVKPNDIVIHVGDLSFGDWRYTSKLLGTLHGRIVLVAGNHDASLVDLFADRLPLVCDKLEGEFNGQFVVMNHEPIASWNKAHYGSVMLYGHCHGGNPNIANPGRYSDVGVDATGKLVSEFDEIVKQTALKPISVHHGD